MSFNITDSSLNTISFKSNITLPTLGIEKSLDTTLNNIHTVYIFYRIFHTILVLFALYLSFKCNKGFDILAFLMAIFFPYIYIIYKFATMGFCTSKDEPNNTDDSTE